MKPIHLANGGITLVDEADFGWLSQWKWWSDKRGYAYRKEPGRGGASIYMHRIILNALKNEKIDHRNGNGLDNRRQNLRVCTHAQNMQNTKIRADNTSGIKGVCWIKARQKWRAEIAATGKRFHLGYFDTKESAKAAYIAAAQKLHGEFARLR